MERLWRALTGVQINLMTKKQLAECFKDYRQAFSDWSVEHDVVLVRSAGPIEQHIAFYALRDGAYRPSCSVEVLISPGVSILPQFLDIKHREISPRGHPTGWPQVVKAMEEQFRPAVRKPLDVNEVLRLEEHDVVSDGIENVNHFNALAALNAYVGDIERALRWCNRVEDHIKAKSGKPFEWELRQANYTQQLQESINLGEHQSFLHSMMHQEES